MSDVPGWMNDGELVALRELAAGKTVLEIGTYRGRSAIEMAGVAKAVWCLDTFRGDAGCGEGWDLPDFYAEVFKAGVRDKIRAIVARWEEALPLLSLSPFDVVFYDADHSYSATLTAGLLMAEKARPDAVLIFHDYADGWPGVIQAVDELAAAGGRKLRRMAGALAVLE